jgi:ubiquinone biosynthesis monooxygenase Coq7
MKGAAKVAPFLFDSPSPMTTRRALSPLDHLLIAADEALKTLAGVQGASRAMPGTELPTRIEDARERALSASLMRVNHTGEICAQALYSGQSLWSREERVRSALRRAASEERDHLAWCSQRLRELDARPSVLDPFWYGGSFLMGMVSGLAGDRWSLGFLAETEDQVERHLDGHLQRLPARDARSRAILSQMREDEARHGASGRALGAAQLPRPVRRAMQAVSRVMTSTAYWV